MHRLDVVAESELARVLGEEVAKGLIDVLGEEGRESGLQAQANVSKPTAQRSPSLRIDPPESCTG